MRVGTGNTRPDAGVDMAGAAGFGHEGSGNKVQLSEVDMRLFRALHKLNAPKQRICSALWLSYAEYDELSKQL